MPLIPTTTCFLVPGLSLWNITTEAQEVSQPLVGFFWEQAMGRETHLLLLELIHEIISHVGKPCRTQH
jgi:hypothetical protein